MAGSPKKRARKLAKEMLKSQGNAHSPEDFNAVYKAIRSEQVRAATELLVAKGKKAQVVMDQEKAKMTYRHLIHTYSLEGELKRLQVEIKLAVDKYVEKKDTIRNPSISLDVAIKLVKILEKLNTNPVLVGATGNVSELKLSWANYGKATEVEEETQVKSKESSVEYVEDVSDPVKSPKYLKAVEDIKKVERKLKNLERALLAEASDTPIKVVKKKATKTKVVKKKAVKIKVSEASAAKTKVVKKKATKTKVAQRKKAVKTKAVK